MRGEAKRKTTFLDLSITISSSTIELQSLNTISHQTPTHEKIPTVDFFNEEEDGDDFDEFDDLPLILDTGIPSAVFNLATSIIGAGIMALPATMNVLGVVVGFVSIILMGILSEISIELLKRFLLWRSRPSCPRPPLPDCLRNLLNCQQCRDSCRLSDHHRGYDVGLLRPCRRLRPWVHRKLVILVVLVVFLAPLCALQKIDSLSLTSAASVALAVVFVVISCIIAIVKVAQGRIDMPRMGPDFGSKAAILELLVVIPMMTNAYACHFNVQPISNELKGRTPHKMNRVGRITMVLCAAVYASTAISGYLLFGDDTESDVLTNFDGQTVDALVFSGSATESRKKTLALTAVLLGIMYLGATTIPNIWVAFKLTGATTGLSLGFIFPSLIALRLRKQGKNLGQ